MLVTELFEGQGLGNQLANYVTVRTIALDKGFKFGVQHPERFKGHFLNLDMGELVMGGVTPVEGQEPTTLPEGITSYYKETSSDYDPHIKDIKDNTSIHGNLQGENYFKHRKEEIREWLRCEPQTFNIPFIGQEDICVMNFRGGEYVGVDDFFLPATYWYTAMDNMRKINPRMRFGVVTDDIQTAQKFFPNLPIKHDMEYDWKCINNAHYLILSNSSFGWFPAWLNTNAKAIIAPKFWGRYNRDYWFLEQNKTDGWLYQDKEGNLCQLNT